MADTALKDTLNDLRGLRYLLTRFNPRSKKIDDLDILVKPLDFEKCIHHLQKRGYKTSSHDQALGGRIPGMQVNLTKKGRIKIDLHQDFTWRRKHYLNLQELWNHSAPDRVDPVWDAFLIMINVIFEKTYFTLEDFEIFSRCWKKINNSPEFLKQASQYGWARTYRLFSQWASMLPENRKFPLFLPVSLILVSYIEKFNITSLAYFCFFRIRFFINRRLPYDPI